MDRLESGPLNSRYDQHNQQHHSRHRQHRQDRKTRRSSTRKARHPDPARIALGRFDWHNPQTWAPALAGVDKVYITYHPDLAVAGSVDAVAKLTELARDAGASRLVLLSGRNAAQPHPAH